MTLNAPFADQQTQVSLAVLGMFRLSVETARKAGIDAGEVEKQVAEICLLYTSDADDDCCRV